MPVVWLEDLDTDSREGRRYQAFFLAAFVILPALSLLHFNHKVFGSGEVARTVTGVAPEIVGPWYWPPAREVLTLHILGNDYCLGQDLRNFEKNEDGKRNPCHRTDKWPGGVTWFPVLSPLLMIAFGTWASIATIRLLLAIRFFRPRRQLAKS